MIIQLAEPGALLRGSPGSCVLGTLLGETSEVSSICPPGVTELCNYAGVQIAEREHPMLQGDAVSCTSMPDDTALFFCGAPRQTWPLFGIPHLPRRSAAAGRKAARKPRSSGRKDTADEGDYPARLGAL